MGKKVSMQSIADELKISKSLVSKALSNKHGVSEETKKNVILTANRLGYKTNSSIMMVPSSENGTIALLVPKEDMTDIEYWGKVIHGVEAELSKNLYSLILSALDTTQPASKGIPSCISDRKVDGAIIVGRVQTTFVHAIYATGIPVVLVDSENLSNLKLDHVLADNFGGGYEATRYLLENNHQRIGFVGDTSYSLSFRERYRGFTSAGDDFIQEFNNKKIELISISDRRENEIIPFSKVQVVKVLKSKNRPTAFLCANDPIAMIVLKTIEELGIRCPEDVSLIGFDNLNECKWMSPKLTSIDACKTTIGRRAAELMLRRVEHPNRRPECVMIMTQIYKRESVINK
ncbi:MAG: substrate-binding domain-containing protein [Bacteroidales bacterium]|nr:substrate-binding domain-containing protein [Bacteroidales bacterium]